MCSRKKSGSSFELLRRRIPEFDDGHPGPAPVGSFDPDANDLRDLGGNVSEWCHDFYAIYTYDAETVAADPAGPDSGQHHAVRGASWRNASMSLLRLSYRDYESDKRDDLGFRVARTLAEEELPDEE